MRFGLTIAVAATLTAYPAYADCMAEVGRTYAEAVTLPPSKGKSALLEQIERAANDHHEGDEQGCSEELASATDVLRAVHMQKAEAGAAKSGGTTGSTRDGSTGNGTVPVKPR